MMTQSELLRRRRQMHRRIRTLLAQRRLMAASAEAPAPETATPEADHVRGLDAAGPGNDLN